MNDLGPPRTAPQLDLVDLMGLTAVFSTLDLEGRAVLARFFTPVDLRAGARLITQGEDADTLYIIAAGSVEVVAEEDGQHVRLVRLGPGEVLGETALNHGGPRNASVDVMEDGLAWAMPVAAFQALASAGDPVAPAVLQGLGRVLCQRLRATDQRIADRTEEEPLPPALTAQVRSPQGTQAIAPAGPELLPLMRTLPIFAGAAARSMDDLTRLLPFLRVWTLPAGGALFTEGAPGTSAFLLLRGVVEVTVERGLEQQRLAILGPGRLFGEVSLIDGAPRSASCTAVQPAVVLELDQAQFAEMVHSESTLAARLIRVMNRNLSAALAGARQTLLAMTSPAVPSPPTSVPAAREQPDAPVPPTALEAVRAAVPTAERRGTGPCSVLRLSAGERGWPSPPIEAAAQAMLVHPADRLRPMLEARVREHFGARPDDALVTLGTGGPTDGVLELLQLAVPHAILEAFELRTQLTPDNRPALFIPRDLPPAWADPLRETVCDTVGLAVHHDGRPDIEAMEAALLHHGHRPARVVVLPITHPNTGVVLDQPGLSQVAHACGAVIVWIGREASANPPCQLRPLPGTPGAQAYSDVLCVDLASLPGGAGGPAIALVGQHLVELGARLRPVPLVALARAVCALDLIEGVGPKGTAQMQERARNAVIQAIVDEPNLRLVGTPQANRRGRLSFRARGRTGSIPAPLAKRIALDHFALELGTLDDNGALVADVPWWLSDAALQHAAWALTQLARHANSLREQYRQDALGDWQHRDATGPAPLRSVGTPGQEADWTELAAQWASAERCTG